MDKQFDDLSKSLAEGVSRREALRKFGFGLAGVVLAAVGLSSRARAAGQPCASNADCPNSETCCNSVCTNLDNDANCGACGYICAAGTKCHKEKFSFYGKHGYF